MSHYTLNEWIILGDVGTSSKTIWAVLQGVDYIGTIPYDPDDFGRCYKLIQQCRISEDDLKKVAKVLPYWKPFIDNWSKLTEMYEQNVRENWVNQEEIGMYEFMSELRKH